MTAKPSGGWGPSHQTARRRRRQPLWVRAWLTAAVLICAAAKTSTAVSIMIILGGYLLLRLASSRLAVGRANRTAGSSLLRTDDPLGAVRGCCRQLGGGVYLGVDERGGWRLAGRERAVMVLGPPRSGKTSAVITPAVLAHAGPAICTSTKPDLLAATIGCRSRLGQVWQFDPTASQPAGGAQELRWSPVTAAGSWDGALLVARAMVTTTSVGLGTSDQSHWSRRAQALLAPLLHAAAASKRDIGTVCEWVAGHELDQPGALLQKAGARLACGALTGIQNTEARERSSILSAAADALDCYQSSGALAVATRPNFDADHFVRSCDAIYVHAPADQQALAAPLVCGLLAEIRAATYNAYRAGCLAGRVLFALDEAANIAPIAELPQIASEGGGQGLTHLAAFQDLSQARQRWGPAADGFLTLFGAKLILPGVADPRTLEAISLALGEYDRQVVSTTRSPNPRSLLIAQTSRTISTQRQRVLSPGEVASIPAGHGLYLDGVAWQLLALTPAHRSEPWRTLTQGAR